jgi:hypothetical protein
MLTRLTPTPTHDSSLYTMSGSALLPLTIPPYAGRLATADGCSKRASVDRAHREVRASCLYPIVPPLYVDALPTPPPNPTPADWATMWKTAMHGAGYTDACCTAASYRRCILQGEDGGGLGLFGTTRNPLGCVVELAHQLQRSAILLHYVTAVTLQYYLMARGLVLRLRTDKGAPFSEALPPYLYMMFRGHHWKIEQGMVEGLPSIATAADLDRLASYNSFPLVLYQVMRWVQTTYPKAATLTGYGESKKDDVDSFCFEKLRKNFLQALMCMRFREAVPVNICERVGGGAQECVIKFFPHPKAGTIRTLDVKSTPPETVDRMPMFFAHCFFSPYEPVFVSAEPTVGASALWQLLLYYPLSDFDKTIVSAARLVFQTVPSAPGVGALNAVRARYTFYVHHDVAYALVPNLLLGEGEIPHDESSVLSISPMAWEWLCNNGSAFDLLGGGDRYATTPRPGMLPAAEGRLYYSPTLVGHLTDTECHAIRRQLLLASPPTNAYWYFSLVARLSSSEAVAAYSTARFFTLARVQDDFQNVRKGVLDLVDTHWSPAAMATLRARWDRCTDGSVNATDMALTPTQFEVLYLSRPVLFPRASIGFGESTWVAQWRRAEEIPSLMQAMTHAKAAFSRATIVHELKQATAAGIERTPSHLAALRVLCQLIDLCPDEMGADMRELLPRVQQVVMSPVP